MPNGHCCSNQAILPLRCAGVSCQMCFPWRLQSNKPGPTDKLTHSHAAPKSCLLQDYTFYVPQWNHSCYPHILRLPAHCTAMHQLSRQQSSLGLTNRRADSEMSHGMPQRYPSSIAPIAPLPCPASLHCQPQPLDTPHAQRRCSSWTAHPPLPRSRANTDPQQA